MEFQAAQEDMKDAYLGGGSGVLISSLVWLVAGLVAIYTTAQASLLVYFFGGMLIHPISILVDKLFKRRGTHLKENPLGHLAMESTIILFIGLYLAYSLFKVYPHWLFPIMLLTIGVRYLIFQTIYGMRIYWVLGMALIIAGTIGMRSDFAIYTFGIIGGAIEFIFAMLILSNEIRNTKKMA